MKARNYIILIMIFLFSLRNYSQVPDTIWTKTYGGTNDDGCYSGNLVYEGGFILTGYTRSFGFSERDVWLIKTNAMGDTLWTKTFGGYDDDRGYSVEQTSDSGYIIAGNTLSFGEGGYDVWLIKTNKFGDTIWTKTFGGISDDGGRSVQQTTDGGYILTGSTRSFGAGAYDVWLIKTDAAGDTLWTKTFGGSLDDGGRSVQQTTDGGYIIIGYTFSFSAGSNDIWLIKTDSSGDKIWDKNFGTSSGDAGYSVQQTSDSGYILTGISEGDVCLVKTDTLGTEVWTKKFGGASEDVGLSIQQTSDHGYIITGYTLSFGSGTNDLWLLKTNSFGDTLWTKTLGGSIADIGYSILENEGGGYTIFGFTGSFGQGGGDVWLIRTSSDLSEAKSNKYLTTSEFQLFQNYPNPFNPSTTIRYVIPERSFVTIKVFDILGNEVATLVNDEKSAGNYELKFKPTGLPSGIYFYQLQVQELIQTKKMLFLK